MLCIAALLTCCSSAVLCTMDTPSGEAAAGAALAEALAHFGAGPGPGAGAGWRLAGLEAAMEGAGFHRRRRYEVVLQRGGAYSCSIGSSSGHEPARMAHPMVDAPPGAERCSGAAALASAPVPERVEGLDAPLAAECGSEGVACEAAVLQVAAKLK